MDISKLFSEFGFAGIVTGTLFFILWRMLIWVMAFIKDMTKQHNEERIVWTGILNNLNQSITIHNQGSIEARKTQEEAHKFQRFEHLKLAEQNEEICKTLVRINGHK